MHKFCHCLLLISLKLVYINRRSIKSSTFIIVSAKSHNGMNTCVKQYNIQLQLRDKTNVLPVTFIDKSSPLGTCLSLMIVSLWVGMFWSCCRPGPSPLLVARCHTRWRGCAEYRQSGGPAPGLTLTTARPSLWPSSISGNWRRSRSLSTAQVMSLNCLKLDCYVMLSRDNLSRNSNIFQNQPVGLREAVKSETGK